MGALEQVTINQKRLPKKLFLYCNYVGQYKKISSVFNNLKANVRPHFYATNDSMAIYYDDPKVVQDPNYCRAVVGIQLEEEERDKALQFISQNKIFQLRDLPEVNALSAHYPFKSALSFIFIVAKVYPEIKAFAYKNKLISGAEEIQQMIEIYHTQDLSPTVEVALPFGEGIEALSFSSQPAPLHKSIGNKKLN